MQSVSIRLPGEVVARLDELATNTSGSRGEVVEVLLRQAQVEHLQRPVVTVTLPEVSEAVTSE
jgi:predicted transcriptional regulator